MSPETRWLPLFPLNTVLFPNTHMPLQVFEERYKTMMQHCLDGDSRFGVVLIRSGSEVGEPAEPQTVGTVAKIIQVNRVSDDRMFISVQGERRFEIKEITQRTPYMAADVELLEDDAEELVPPTEMEAIRLAIANHVKLAMGLNGGWVRDARSPSDPTELSYFIAGTLQVGLQEKQNILEEDSVAKRLELELDLLRRESEGMKRRVARELRQRFGRQ